MDRGGWNYPPGEIRVSDADRDRAVSELAVALQAGRLTADEFDQRSGQALRARTGKELTALLADLPVERALATRTTGEQGRRILATRIAMVATAASAFAFGTSAVAAALSAGPTAQQRELIRQMAARQGFPLRPGFPPDPGFNWIGTIAPGVIAVLLVAVTIALGVRLVRATRA
jgi:hypothetical protein